MTLEEGPPGVSRVGQTDAGLVLILPLVGRVIRQQESPTPRPFVIACFQ